jgi:hypothetical protein
MTCTFTVGLLHRFVIISAGTIVPWGRAAGWFFPGFLAQGGRIMSRLTKIVALLLAVFIAVPLLAAERKKGAKARAVPQQFQLPKEITLTADQQKKLGELVATYGPKLEAIQKQRSDMLTEEQKKAGSEARKKAEAAGKPSKEVTQAVDEAMKLTPEQTTKLAALRKETSPISNEIRGKLLDILTPEQKVQFEKAEQKKKEGTKK